MKNQTTHVIVKKSNHPELLRSAVKWLRAIEDRREEMPVGMFRHGADPAPLRKQIEKALSNES